VNSLNTAPIVAIALVCALVLAGVMTFFPKLIPSARPGSAHVATQVKH
jgi:hypothetical protein